MKRIGIVVICGTTLFLSSCALLRPAEQQQTGENAQTAESPNSKTDSDEKKEDNEEIAEEAPPGVLPTSEQQEAALHMLSSGEAAGPVISSESSTIPEPMPDEDFSYTTSSVPGGRGLRLGNLAPPEEAASSNDHAAPRPNSVEMHGLRSPSLPKGLPMDINGKLTPSEE